MVMAGIPANGNDAMAERSADGLILTYYGDDFTGSTDSLEALAMAGVPAMLFLEPPSRERLARYPGIRAVGVAGTSRSQSPAWMDAHLPRIFERLRALGAPLCHYKTCSTFDSSPEVGSIGRAAELGKSVFGGSVLAVVGVPRHNRYVIFSTLFAAASISGAKEIFRIDRHPTMSRHPVTPMAEADLRIHLAAQTRLRITGFDMTQMLAPEASQALEAECGRHDIVLLDSFDERTMRIAGRLLTEHGARQPAFVVGSSGVEYGVTDHLSTAGILPLAPPPTPREPADRLIAVCGSCSPVTDSQISWAESNGFATVTLDPVAMIEAPAATELLFSHQIEQALLDHAGVVLYTARGPADPQIARTREALTRRGYSVRDSAEILGGWCGRALRAALAKTGVRRVVLAGGDSSSHAVSAMGIDAFSVAGPLVPGAPLCRIESSDPTVDGVEIALKGGQVGGPDFFARVLAGR